MAKYALPHLRKTKGATIINMTSVNHYIGRADLLDYTSTKGAIVAFTRALSNQVVGDGIRVNAIAPGPVWTPLVVSTMGKENLEQFNATPMGRPGQVSEPMECVATEDSPRVFSPPKLRRVAFSSPARTAASSAARLCIRTVGRWSTVEVRILIEHPIVYVLPCNASSAPESKGRRSTWTWQERPSRLAQQKGQLASFREFKPVLSHAVLSVEDLDAGQLSPSSRQLARNAKAGYWLPRYYLGYARSH